MAREVIDIIIQERGGRQVTRTVRDIGGAATSSAGAVQLLRGALRGLGVGLAIREVLRAIDSYQRMENQLRVVGYEQRQLNQAMDDLFSVAQKTRTPLEATVTLYGKLAQSAGELGKSQAEMLEFTELVGTSLAIQGTSTQGSRAALLQLSQAMGEGIVRAQEYNSLIENARPLLVAAAKGMDEAGGSVAKLRSLVLEGSVTSKAFFEAVLAGGDILREQFGNTVPTIGQALTKLNNAWTKFIGESSLGQGILAAVSGVLIFLADNFETVALAATIAGAAVTAWVGGGILGALITRTATAIGLQFALAGGFTAVNAASILATGGIRAVVGGVRVLTAVIAANPIGALLVAAIALAGYLYTLRDSLVTFGNTTASVGSIIQEVWSRAVTVIKEVWVWYKQVFTDMWSSIWQFFVDTKDALNDFLKSWGTTLNTIGGYIKTFVNTAIGLFVGLISALGPIVTRGIPAMFKLALGVAQNAVVIAMQNIINIVVNALGGVGDALSYIPGVADDLGSSIRASLDVDLSGLLADTEALKTEMSAAGDAIKGKFNTALDVDYIGAAEKGLINVKDAIAGTTQEIVNAAAARDAAATNNPVEDFKFTPPTGATGAGGGAGGAGKKSKAEQTAFQKAYRALIDETTGSLKTLVAQQQALDAAFANGLINQEQYVVKQQEIKTGLAEWATEGRNAAAALREANVAILEMKINAGDGSFADGFLVGLARMTEGAVNFSAQSGQIFADYFDQLSDGIANSIGKAVVYSENLGEALSNVAKEALAGLISAFVKLGIQWLINAAIGRTLQASATAATTAQATAAAAAWAPAAALASLATSGANAGPAATAIASTTALAAGVAASSKAVSAFADGGQVTGPGGPRDDKVLALLSNKEFVVNAKSAEENMPLLQAINSGANLKRLFPTYANGGIVLPSNTSTHSDKQLSGAVARDVKLSQRAGGNTQPQAAETQPPEQNFVFLQDPELVGQYLQTTNGKEAVIKILTDEGIMDG